MKRIILTVMLGACGDNVGPDVHVIDVDAGADVVCLDDASADDCCRFLPDVDAARTCASASAPLDTCGALACARHDCSHVRVDFCGPKSDAGL